MPTRTAIEPEKPKKRMTYSEKREWETIESDIEKKEEEIAATEAEMMSSGANYDRVSELTKQLDKLNEEYEQLIERWTYLQEIAES